MITSLHATCFSNVLRYCLNFNPAVFQKRDHDNKFLAIEYIIKFIVYYIFIPPYRLEFSFLSSDLKNLSLVTLKSRSTEKHELIGPKAKILAVFFHVVFGCTFFDNVLQFWFLSKSYGFMASNLKHFFWTGLYNSV